MGGYYDISGDDEEDVSGYDYDISGLEALLGDDDEMLGISLKSLARGALMPHTLAQRALASRKKSKVAARAMVAQAAARGALVQAKGPSRSRRLMLPVDSTTTIAAAASSTINLTPTNTFKPDRFVVDSAIAPAFVITDIKVGRASQLIGTGSIPAVAFSPALGENNIGFDTVQTSQPLSVAVTNTSGAALRFMGVFFGWEIE